MRKAATIVGAAGPAGVDGVETVAELIEAWMAQYGDDWYHHRLTSWYQFAGAVPLSLGHPPVSPAEGCAEVRGDRVREVARKLQSPLKPAARKRSQPGIPWVAGKKTRPPKGGERRKLLETSDL